jgi:hypothetical protein
MCCRTAPCVSVLHASSLLVWQCHVQRCMALGGSATRSRAVYINLFRWNVAAPHAWCCSGPCSGVVSQCLSAVHITNVTFVSLWYGDLVRSAVLVDLITTAFSVSVQHATYRGVPHVLQHYSSMWCWAILPTADLSLFCSLAFCSLPGYYRTAALSSGLPDTHDESRRWPSITDARMFAACLF